MKNVLGALFVAVTLTCSAAAQPSLSLQSPGSTGADADAIKALLRQMTADSAKGDPNALDKYFSPNAVVIDRGGVTQGWAKYKSQQLVWQMSEVQNASQRIQAGGHAVGDILVNVSGSTAWTVYSFSVTTAFNGETREVWGIGSMTLLKSGGKWQVVQSQTLGRPRENWGTGPTQ